LLLEELIHPQKVYSREEVLTKDCPVPIDSGLYAWFLKNLPSNVPTADCINYKDLKLLYIGIAPRKPTKVGKKSSQTLRSRIRKHYRGNAYGSTLRLTLGCLLSEELDIELRRIGSGKRMTFTKSGEEKLSKWMQENAFVIWETHPEPWKLEPIALTTLSPPLNIRGDEHHPFYSALSLIRKEAKIRARKLKIVS